MKANIIQPQEGYYLTQAYRREDEQPILSKLVILSKADSPQNWKEITEEEGDEMLAKFNEEQEKRMTNATR